MNRALLTLFLSMSVLSTVWSQTGNTAYDQWITRYNLHNQAAAFTNDFDSDGATNGDEWALGGNPTNINDKGISTVRIGIEGESFLYIYPRLTNTTTRPAYTLLSTENLTSGSNLVQVKNVDFTETFGGCWSSNQPAFEVVTNVFATTKPTEFFKLQITLNELPYLSQPSPGQTSQPFAPGIISLPDRYDQDVVWSPDGLELLFMETDNYWNGKQMWYANAKNGQWTDLQPISSAQELPESSFFYSPYAGTLPHTDGLSVDGKASYFTKTLNSIWKTERTMQGWTEPVDLNIAIPSDHDIWYLSATDQGTLYMTLANAQGTQSFLYRSRCINGIYQPLENLSIRLGYTSGFYVIVAPDESYLIVNMYGLPGGYGGNDLWIFHNDGEDNWSPRMNLGPKVNSPREDIAPHVSRDGKYLFFARRGPWPGNVQYAESYWIEASAVLPTNNND